MKASKINSKATYHKCMKELELLGFMQYNPTFNPHSCSNIIMVNFSDEEKANSKIPQPTGSKNEPVHNLTDSKNEHVIEHVNEPLYIYNKKQTVKNNLNNTKIDIEKISRIEPVQNLNPLIIPKEKKAVPFAFADTDKKQAESGRQKSCAKKEKPVELDLIFESTVPSLEMVLEYFSFKESSQIEANKFFNYYCSIGWLVGGKTKMKDWKAAARNWMLNTTKFAANVAKSDYNSQPKPMHLHTATHKNYDEPL
jgi:hypothetical protein